MPSQNIISIFLFKFFLFLKTKVILFNLWDLLFKSVQLQKANMVIFIILFYYNRYWAIFLI